MAAQAIARNVKISPRKAGLVSSLVRGRLVEDALVILDHTPKKAAPIIKKVINSAVANATTNHGLQEKGLRISSLTVDIGPALKRFRPAAMGRALPYKHQTSHIRVIVEGVGKPSQKKPATKKAPSTSSKTASNNRKETA